MQAKDVPVEPVLRFLSRQFDHDPRLGRVDRWCTWGASSRIPTVADAMPPGTPEKVQLAKMRRLMRRGLVDGCDCGCRGDFRLTDEGRDFLLELDLEAQELEPDVEVPVKLRDEWKGRLCS